MFTRTRGLAAATVVGVLAVAGPVAGANAAPMPSAGASVTASAAFPGYRPPGRPGYPGDHRPPSRPGHWGDHRPPGRPGHPGGPWNGRHDHRPGPRTASTAP
jgi:hypothetical protein